MSLSEQLEELERQRAVEVRNLHCTYLRTKREVQRAASPTRFVRKHLTVWLAAGTALGLILAPRPAPRPVSEEATERAVRNAHRRAGISMSWAKRMLTKFFPQVAEYLPDDEQVSTARETVHEEAEQVREEVKKEGKAQKKTAGHPALRSLMRLLEAVLPLVASKVDWRSLVNLVMHGVYSKMKEGGHNGHEPHVSVADAGTVKPQDFENFE